MKNQTKLICVGAVFMILLSSVIMLAIYDDVDGPLIYQIDLLPVDPAVGDTIRVIAYALDTSGVSNVQLSFTTDGTNWTSIATGLNDNGSYNGWTVPAINSTTVRVRITATDDATIDITADPFTASMYLSSGEFALVEANEPFSCGWYGDPQNIELYIQWLISGWVYMKNYK